MDDVEIRDRARVLLVVTLLRILTAISTAAVLYVVVQAVRSWLAL